MMKRTILILVALVSAITMNAQQAIDPDPQVENAIADKIIAKMLPYRDKPVNELMIVAAQAMLGTPYVGGTLDKADNEKVRVFLDQTDCIIFVETCLNLALDVKEYGDQANYDHLVDLVRQSRYRDGIDKNYSDRVHYTTEWIRQGEKRGIVKDITLDLGGKIYDNPICFMSKNHTKYAHLADTSDPKVAADLAKIAEVEKELNKKPFSYLPDEQLAAAAAAGKIRSGDIICYMSATPGLDIDHVAIAYVHDGVVGFMHASSREMKVVVDKKSIADYSAGRKGTPGIKVVRVL